MAKILYPLIILFLFFSCTPSKKRNDRNPESKESQILISPKPFIERIDGKLVEISGLMIYEELFWGFNDSGGKKSIYGFDRSGNIKKEIVFEDAENIDWESIAQDEKNIYIGDFGNNNGNRKNLCIYKIKKQAIKAKKEQSVKAKKIAFQYATQENFSWLTNNNPFDCEAMTEFNGLLYLFSKDWTNGTTIVYRIPTKKGDYTIQPLDTFDVNGLVTGADISSDGKHLVLVGYKNYQSYMWLFSRFPDDRFFEGDHIHFKLDKLADAQTEGICFVGNDSVLVSCERSRSFNQQVFLFDLTEYTNGTYSDKPENKTGTN